MVRRLKDSIHHGGGRHGGGNLRWLVTFASGVRKQRERMLVLSCLLVFILSRTPAHRMVLPTFRMGLPAQLNQSRSSLMDTPRGVS